MNGAVRLALLIGSLVGMAGTTMAQQQPTARQMSDRIQDAKKLPQVMLASAEPAPASAANGAPDRPMPAKRVAPRITTCRCGDPLPASKPDER